jgi:hypothetical protein
MAQNLSSSSNNTKPVQQEFCNPFLSLTHTHSETILNCQYYNHPSTDEAPPFQGLPYAPMTLWLPTSGTPRKQCYAQGTAFKGFLMQFWFKPWSLQLPLCMYFLCQRVKPHILHSLSNCTGHSSGNAVKKDAKCYTPSVHTPQSGQGLVSHATPARCFCSDISDCGVIPWFLTSVAWALEMGVEEI